MTNNIRTNSEHPDFIALVKLLDAELALADGDDHAFYSQYNKIHNIQHVIIKYQNEQPVGCGAIKPFSTDAMEVKRMYIVPEYRKQGIATQILKALENWAKELGYACCVLETGKRQPEAIALYQKNGYRITENYGQYIRVENSVCFEKVIL
jgi:GNAT superfamily N-acetyltransferase